MNTHSSKALTFFVISLVTLAVASSFTFLRIGHPADEPMEISQMPPSAFQKGEKPAGFPLQDAPKAEIKSSFGMRKSPFTHQMKMHTGVDIVSPIGTKVVATASGTIREVGNKPNGVGIYVIIDHGPIYSTMYTHLKDFSVENGQEIRKGELVGHVGTTGKSTGAHLHYEVMKEGKNVDPEAYFTMK